MLRDIYLRGVTDKQLGGASQQWSEMAISHLNSEWGEGVLRDAVEELIKHETESRGSLTFDQFVHTLSSERKRRLSRVPTWKFAPLCDIPLNMSSVANGPNFEFKAQLTPVESYSQNRYIGQVTCKLLTIIIRVELWQTQVTIYQR